MQLPSLHSSSQRGTSRALQARSRGSGTPGIG
jgi:hypothetical protein